MTTNDPHERFLELEEQANQLVDSLAKLRTEAESYQTATGHLAEVSGQILITLEGIQTATIAITETAQKLNEIGTPEILSRLDKVETKFSRLVQIDRKLQEIDQQSKRSILARLLTFS